MATTTAPPLPVAKADYLRGGIFKVEGWLNRSTATYLSAIEVLQPRLGIEGDVCEIGVHHGKSFLTLALGLAPDCRAVAVDVFEDQSRNPDGSGLGNRAILEQNLAAHGVNDNVDIIQASSLDLDTNGFVARGRRFRLFSIDGSHTPELTTNDLRVAERTLVERGVAALDDVLNPAWLGVVTGLFRYWSDGGTLVPSAVLPGRLLLATNVDQAAAYRDLLGEHFAVARVKRDVPLGDHRVDVFDEFPWVIADDEGGTGLLAGAKPPATAVRRTQAVPVEYLADLERRAAPLPKRLARRFPPAVRLYRFLRGAIARR